MNITIEGVHFTITQKEGERTLVEFEATNKEVVEIPFDREEFLKYFSDSITSRIEKCLQKYFSTP